MEISDEDLKLLMDIYDRGGTARIFGPRNLQSGERLVRAGYATAHPLNWAEIEFRITEAGRRKVRAVRRANFFDRD
jgi:hypothetical protein